MIFLEGVYLDRTEAGLKPRFLMVGGPEECIRYLGNMQRLGITHVLFRPAMGDQKYVLQTIRLLGTDVIPHFAHA